MARGFEGRRNAIENRKRTTDRPTDRPTTTTTAAITASSFLKPRVLKDDGGLVEIQSKDLIARGFHLSRYTYIITKIIFVNEKKEEESVKVVETRHRLEA